jgi:type II secretory pathway pseudopilin PulG
MNMVFFQSVRLLLLGKIKGCDPRGARKAAAVTRPTKGEGGFTLVETMMAAGTLAIVAGASISALTLLNNRAAVERNQSAAKELCQQAIEQALALPFDPPTTVPSIFGTWPPPATTASEPVQLYVQKEDESTSVVQGTRTNSVAFANSSTNLIQFTTNVTYRYRGKQYSYEMYTLRAPR